MLCRVVKTLQSLGLSVDPPPQTGPGKGVKGTAQVPVPRGEGTESGEGKFVPSLLEYSKIREGFVMLSARSSPEQSDDSNEDTPMTPKKPVQRSISSSDATRSCEF